MTSVTAAQKIYVLGAGSMGSLVAHELKTMHPNIAQTILLFKNQQRYNGFIAKDSQLTISRQNGDNIHTSQSQMPSWAQPPTLKGGGYAPIDNLIISTKVYQTEAAIKPYISNITPKSNILFLQNGMGMVERLTENLWPNADLRPNLFQAISTHGAYMSLPHVIHHVGLGKLSISNIPKTKTYNPNLEMPDFIKLLVETPNLNTEYVPYDSLILIQMEKLIVNACINPMTAILDCLNGDLLYGSKIITLFKRIICESVDCFKKEYTILLQIPEANSFLSDDRLLNSVLEVCKLTSKNSSSMREDVKNLRHTEIDWINGFIIRLGQKHEISTPVNALLSSMVKNKLSINKSIDDASTELFLDIQ